MRRLLCVTAVGVVLAGPVAVTAASQASATPGSTSEPVRAHARTHLLGVRALTVRGHGAVDVDLAVSHASADSGASQDRRAAASAANLDVRADGQDVLGPTEVNQHALPNNPRPATRGLDLTGTPLAALVQARLLTGSALAHWSDSAGPCAGDPISSGVTTAADLSLLNASLLPRLPQLTALPAGLGQHSAVSLPGTVQATSSVALRDVPGQSGRAVVATSTLNLADLTLFDGTASEIRVRVLSRPTLTATSTGEAAGSGVHYEAPVLEVARGGRVLGRITATRPMNVPLVGDLPQHLDLGAVELSLGRFHQQRQGAEVSGSAALLDVRVLTAAGGQAVLEAVVGEQEVSALAPAGGVRCEGPGNPGGPGGPGTPGQPGGHGDNGVSGPAPTSGGRELAMTNAAYNPVPYILVGGLLLLVGSVLVAAVPHWRRGSTGTTASDA
jgi:hypothetical protein